MKRQFLPKYQREYQSPCKIKFDPYSLIPYLSASATCLIIFFLVIYNNIITAIKMGNSVFIPMVSNLLDINFVALVVAFVVTTVTAARLFGQFRRRWRTERGLNQFPCYDRHWLLGHMNLVSSKDY